MKLLKIFIVGIVPLLLSACASSKTLAVMNPDIRPSNLNEVMVIPVGAAFTPSPCVSALVDKDACKPEVEKYTNLVMSGKNKNGLSYDSTPEYSITMPGSKETIKTNVHYMPFGVACNSQLKTILDSYVKEYGLSGFYSMEEAFTLKNTDIIARDKSLVNCLEGKGDNLLLVSYSGTFDPAMVQPEGSTLLGRMWKAGSPPHGTMSSLLVGKNREILAYRPNPYQLMYGQVPRRANFIDAMKNTYNDTYAEPDATDLSSVYKSTVINIKTSASAERK